ncbi:MAG: hypothetical protein KTR22_00900 [Flavobacteriaceae bacterium]|nr:hypothetical protein [Flavobacteriaceae bacterium]
MKTPIAYAYLIAFLVITLTSCKDDDSRTCRECTNEQTPAFELCREPNGNASVNGQDTGTDYDVYLADLEEVGSNCSG